jgi:SWI/SNF chromatin-remodeling complex subunit SWI1
LPASELLSLSDFLTIRKDILYTLSSISGLINLSRHTSFHRLGLRIFDLMASYLVDPTDAVSPLASVQIAGVVPSANLKPPALADVALEVFTRFSQSDSNRQVIANIVPSSSLWLLLTRLVHRLPIVDADFVLMQREYWLSFVEKIVMAIYSLVFLAPPDLKQKIRTDRTLAFKSVMLRMVHKAVMMPSHDGRSSTTIVFAKRAVEAMKVLDSTEDVFQQSAEATMPILSFGMGFAEAGDIGLEKGTGILGGKGDVAWEMMMLRDVFQDERMFNELDSLVRVEY